LPANVWLTAVISFLTDIVSFMLEPQLYICETA